MNARVLKRIFGFLMVITLIFAIGFVFARNYLTQKPAILYRYKDAAAVNPSSELLVIFNPFRDQASEAEAEKFFEALRTGKYEQFKTAIHIDCERENNKDVYAITSLNLLNREESGDKIKLHYEVERVAYKQGLGNVWVTLEKDSDVWKIINYEAWY